MATTLAERDYFTDHSILRDPYAYFEALRAHGPIYRHPVSDVLFVTGFDEAVEVLRNTQDFSSSISVQGAAVQLPFQPEGSDITAEIERNRAGLLGGDLLVTQDDKFHLKVRSLLTKLFTPSRLKANEEFIAEYSDRIVRDAVETGHCELVRQIATPYVTLVIADLLGVPEGDRQFFMDAIEAAPPPGSLDIGASLEELEQQNRPLVIMGMYFVDYVNDRRAHPQDDVLTELATATYPDGELPDAMEIVRLGTFLFGAGQDTSAKLLGNAMRFLCEDQELQDRCRADPSLIPALLEETLRLEGSTKMTSRLARRDTRIGDLAVPAGTRVMLALSAANRDEKRWGCPNDFQLDRPKIKEHVGFGRGAHVCPGAPLARVEVRVILEKFLAYTSKIEIDAERHGPPGARTLQYEPSFIIRGLGELYLKLTPAKDFVASAKPEAAAEQGGGMLKTLGRLFGSKTKTVATRYSTQDSTLADLLANPETVAVLDRHFPGVSTDARIGMAKGMTLRRVQRFAPDMFPDDKLDAADQDLAKIAVR